MNNFFPVEIIKPNSECSNNFCLKNQGKYNGLWHPQEWRGIGHDGEEGKAVVHEDNEWGIR